MSTQLFRATILLILSIIVLVGCGSAPTAAIHPAPTAYSPTSTQPGAATQDPPTPTFDPEKYAFPQSIDPEKQYLFYVHGRIIEDQGLPAVSPDFGEYEYPAILEKFSGYGFVVISELRAKNTNSSAYAQRVADQVTTLIAAGVPPGNITVVGASKGGAIAVLASNLLTNAQLNFVIMAICNPEMVNEWVQNGLVLYGNVLSIYDASDELAGSCQDLFLISEGKGLTKYDEIVLNIGTGHGILYQPLDVWVVPTVKWSGE